MSEAVVLHETIETHAFSTSKHLLRTRDWFLFKNWDFQSFSKKWGFMKKLISLLWNIKRQLQNVPLGENQTSNTFRDPNGSAFDLKCSNFWVFTTSLGKENEFLKRLLDWLWARCAIYSSRRGSALRVKKTNFLNVFYSRPAVNRQPGYRRGDS